MNYSVKYLPGQSVSSMIIGALWGLHTTPEYAKSYTSEKSSAATYCFNKGNLHKEYWWLTESYLELNHRALGFIAILLVDFFNHLIKLRVKETIHHLNSI